MYDFIIIGAGIVGLAVGLKLTEKYPSAKLLIIEKENAVAKHQTGNNSGVIHSGIYYAPNSLKALNCKRGYELLLDFCNKNDIKYEICGKIIVATCQEEIPALENLHQRGLDNGLQGLKLLEKDKIKEYEPYATGEKALFVPQTGIIDYSVVSNKFKEIIEKNGGKFIFKNKVINITQNHDSITVKTDKDVYETNKVISCAGLYSDKIAMMTEKVVNFRIIPFRGEYFKIKENKTLVKNLIYPVPDTAFPFLGVHFTKGINGEVEAGPNAVLSFKKEGYRKTDFNFKDTFDIFVWKGFRKVIFKYFLVGIGEFYRSFSKDAFVSALKKLVPVITESDLSKGGSGVRAQACDVKGKLIDDFYFVGNKNIVHVCNAPSPAATASLAIAEQILERIK